MPWLIKSEEGDDAKPPLPLSRHLFFVHIPRCGGTSLMQHFGVPEKVYAGRWLVPRLSMKYFFMRYAQLEEANFPTYTKENAFCLALLCVSALMTWSDDRSSSLDTAGPVPMIALSPIFIFLGWCAAFPALGMYLLDARLPFIVGTQLSTVAVFLASFAVFLSSVTTFLWTAPIIGRIMPIHRWYLWFVSFPIFHLCEALDWMTGTNKHGYLMHLTAPKLLGYGYITPEQMDNMCSLAIVRNPYSRMVSIYGYNRFGQRESFVVFLRRWKRLMRPYIERGEKEDWYTPCHLLPMFEYTHFEGRQLVQSIVKQEELKYLKTKEGAAKISTPWLTSSVSNLPDLVREALLDMPHVNQRATSKKWYDYYDQECLDLTYEMYHMDFKVFGYDTMINDRPDLLPPRGDHWARVRHKGSSADKRLQFTEVGDEQSNDEQHFSHSATEVECMSRNTLFDSATKRRRSNTELFTSAKITVKNDLNRRASAVSLKKSLLELDRVEIFARIAGQRTGLSEPHDDNKED